MLRLYKETYFPVTGNHFKMPFTSKLNVLFFILKVNAILFAGVIGYPVGLLIGIGCCALFHYAVRPRCIKNAGPKRRKMSSANSLSSSRSTVYPARMTPPPRYSTLDLVAESNI
jgi:hypothetical protein